MLDVGEVIKQLGLVPLPGEGGYYAETYRSPFEMDGSMLPGSYLGEPRRLSSAIYYLLSDAPDSFSALHRLKGVEIYHFYLGDPVEMLLLEPSGISRQVVLGQDLAAGQRVQFTVPAGVWQGSRLRSGGRFALMGTTMAPGYEHRDNELGQREDLSGLYPSRVEEITRLTRPDESASRSWNGAT